MTKLPVEKLEECRDILFALLEVKTNPRLWRAYCLVQSALSDFWRPGQEDSPAGLPEEEIELDLT